MGKRTQLGEYANHEQSSFIETPVEPEPTVRYVWKHLSNIDEALRIQGGAYGGLLRQLMPEGKRPVLGWRRGEPLIPDVYQIDEAILKNLKTSFEQSRGRLNKKQWQARAAEALVNRAVRYSDDIDKRTLNRLATYYENAIGQLVKKGIFGPKHSKAYDDLLGRMHDFRSLRQERSICEESLERAANSGRRSMLLGASAVRSVYRAATVVPTRPVIWAFAWYRSQDVLPEDVEYGRRLKPVYLAGVATLGFAAFKAWQMAKGYGAFDFGDHAALPDTTAVLHPPIDVPGPVEVPDQPPVDTTPAFSEGALTIGRGEGWIHQFKEIGISYNQDFMDKVGADLQAKGYAYKAIDPNTGELGWFMNYGSGHIDTETLEWLTEKAKEVPVQ